MPSLRFVFRDEPRCEDCETAGLSHDKEALKQLLEASNPAKEVWHACSPMLLLPLEQQSLNGEMLCSMADIIR